MNLDLAHAAEDGEGILGPGLPDELAARLDLPVQAGREGVRILARGRADDQVAPMADRVVPLPFELLGEGGGGMARAAVDAHLPGGVTVLELLLFPRLARRLVVPALFVVEPVLDPVRAADDRARPLRVRVCVRVDEDVVAVARDREAAAAFCGRQLCEQRARVGGGQMEAEVVDAGILP